MIEQHLHISLRLLRSKPLVEYVPKSQLMLLITY